MFVRQTLRAGELSDDEVRAWSLQVVNKFSLRKLMSVAVSLPRDGVPHSDLPHRKYVSISFLFLFYFFLSFLSLVGSLTNVLLSGKRDVCSSSI
jgi:hypothetical protein